MKCFVTIAALLATVAAEADPALFYGRGILGASPYAYGYAGAAYAPAGLYRGAIAAAPVPVARAIAPAAIAAPAVAVKAAPAPVPAIASSQTHAQDEIGNYEYSYQNINSAKKEAGNSRTGVTGSYSYVDAAGVTRTTNYVADAFGYRAINNIGVPGYAAYTRLHKRSLVAPAPAAYAGLAHPAPLAYAGLAHPAPLAYSGYAHAPATIAADPTAIAASAAYAHPAPVPAAITPVAAPVQQVAYAAPSQAAIPSVRTTIKLNPGHSTFYRVDPAY